MSMVYSWPFSFPVAWTLPVPVVPTGGHAGCASASGPERSPERLKLVIATDVDLGGDVGPAEPAGDVPHPARSITPTTSASMLEAVTLGTGRVRLTGVVGLRE